MKPILHLGFNLLRISNVPLSGKIVALAIAIYAKICCRYVPKDKKNPQIDCDVLRELMSSKTKLFACTHTSNILGTINDVKAIAKTVHEVPGALYCVDAVAFAPHRQVDVADWGVDFYSFSWYG